MLEILLAAIWTFGEALLLILATCAVVFAITDALEFWPIIVIVAASFVIAFISSMIIQNRTYKYNPNDPNRKYDAKGIEIVTKEEEERRSYECAKITIIIGAAISMPLVLVYTVYMY